jgi:hypothetical protein
MQYTISVATTAPPHPYLPFKLGMAKIFNMAKMFRVPFLFKKLEYVP